MDVVGQILVVALALFGAYNLLKYIFRKPKGMN
jgi:hypothetical protein